MRCLTCAVPSGRTGGTWATLCSTTRARRSLGASSMQLNGACCVYSPTSVFLCYPACHAWNAVKCGMPHTACFFIASICFVGMQV